MFHVLIILAIILAALGGLALIAFAVENLGYWWCYFTGTTDVIVRGVFYLVGLLIELW